MVRATTVAARRANPATTCGWPSEVRTSSCPATASSSCAAWSDQAVSSATLACAICGVNGRATSTITAATSGNTTNAGQNTSPATIHATTERSSERPVSQPIRRMSWASWRQSSSTRSRSSPTAWSSSAGSGCASADPTRSDRSLPSARPTTPENRTRPRVSSRAAPSSSAASTATRVAVGPLTTAPTTVAAVASATAATTAAPTATTDTGPPSRRQDSARTPDPPTRPRYGISGAVDDRR